MKQQQWRKPDGTLIGTSIEDEIPMGYILGVGFAFKAKPDAFASSACANKMVQ